MARRLRKYTEIAGDSITLSDYLENRFADRSRILRIVSALFILVFFLIYTASGFVAGAKLFSTVFDISYPSALLLGMFVIIGYTFLGGFMAVSWTDFFQGLIMFFAIVTVPVLGMFACKGVGHMVDTLAASKANFLRPFTDIDGQRLSGIGIISLLAWGLGYFGQPHILARFMAIRSSDRIGKARLIAMTWVVMSLICAVLVGIVGRAHLGSLLEDEKAETVFMVLIGELVPPILAGIFLAAVLAAIMSTADSQLLVTSSAITEDFYRVLFRRSATDRELVWVGRIAVIAVAVLACIMAWNPRNTVLGLVAYAWGGFGATFGPVIILSLFWKRMTKHGALAGLVSGGLTVLIWKQLSGGIFDLYEIVPGFLFSLIAIVLISLRDCRPSADIMELFDRVGKSSI